MTPGRREADALAGLGEIVRRLRVECPWDREQDAASIVPHTVEEAYELADAVAAGDDAAMLDELGDVLFQVFFLALLMEERRAGDLATVADALGAKLVRRHPHVFGEASGDSVRVVDDLDPADGDAVRTNWDRIKQEVEGRQADDVFDDIPAGLPGALYARKLLKRAASHDLDGPAGDPPAAIAAARTALDALEAGVAAGSGGGPEHAPEVREQVGAAVGEALLGAVDAARQVGVDPELALRAAARRRVGLE